MLQDNNDLSDSHCRLEAKFFYRAVVRSRMTREEVKTLIAVPASIDAALRAYVRAYPADGHIVSVLNYRARLWEEVERLVVRTQKRRGKA